MIFDRFDRVRIINLANRPDRRRETEAELARIGVAVDGKRVAFFNACTVDHSGGFYSKGAHGCYLSHLSILEEGGSVLILEDDCDFSSALPSFACGDFDILYGGYDALTPENLQASDIVGAHMMGYSAETSLQVGRYFRKLLVPDFRNNVPPPPADAAIIWFRRAHPDIKTVFAVPPLSFQRPSRTDIGPAKLFDRLPLIREAASLARKTKRKLRSRSI